MPARSGHPDPPMLDVVIVGGGPAGLSAALVLGRGRAAVLVCDTGRPRNYASHAMHGYLTRDGMPPSEFLAVARRELAQYDRVPLRQVEVTGGECQPGGHFKVTLATGEELESRKLLVATGVADKVPDLPGFADLYGRSVFHCPYCDGWEARDTPLAIYGRGRRGSGLALVVTAWSRDLVLCTDGPCELDDEQRAKLGRNAIQLREDGIARLEGEQGVLQH